MKTSFSNPFPSYSLRRLKTIWIFPCCSTTIQAVTSLVSGTLYFRTCPGIVFRVHASRASLHPGFHSSAFNSCEERKDLTNFCSAAIYVPTSTTDLPASLYKNASSSNCMFRVMGVYWCISRENSICRLKCTYFVLNSSVNRNNWVVLRDSWTTWNEFRSHRSHGQSTVILTNILSKVSPFSRTGS